MATPVKISQSRKLGKLCSTELTEINYSVTINYVGCNTCGVHYLHKKQPTMEVVAEKMNMAEMAVTVV